VAAQVEAQDVAGAAEGRHLGVPHRVVVAEGVRERQPRPRRRAVAVDAIGDVDAVDSRVLHLRLYSKRTPSSPPSSVRRRRGRCSAEVSSSSTACGRVRRSVRARATRSATDPVQQGQAGGKADQRHALRPGAIEKRALDQDGATERRHRLQPRVDGRVALGFGCGNAQAHGDGCLLH